ncbi:hypothetical protein GF318_00905 [Candidatus Micrarchaeota archaeon]|nr:hypothetical protein [Candidatus Micrarchaeota archaeon]
MDLFDGILLGFIQGIAEWLPVSSEAMVTLAGKFFSGLEYREAMSTAIWLHSGTLLAALAYFRKDITNLVKDSFSPGPGRQLLIFLAVATAASAVVAFPLLALAVSVEMPEAFATILIGVFLVFIAFFQKNRKQGTKTVLTPLNAGLAGLVQGLAVLPGISRSGITIPVLIAEEYPLKQAFRLSFLMSIPVSFGAQVALPVVEEGFAVDGPMIAGSIVAALVGFATIGVLMRFAEQVNFFKATLVLGLGVIACGALLL